MMAKASSFPWAGGIDVQQWILSRAEYCVALACPIMVGEHLMVIECGYKSNTHSSIFWWWTTADQEFNTCRLQRAFNALPKKLQSAEHWTVFLSDVLYRLFAAQVVCWLCALALSAIQLVCGDVWVELQPTQQSLSCLRPTPTRKGRLRNTTLKPGNE